ncbi:MAG TPA: DUF1990 family protein [Acidimicrobiales bacterium]|nr:DUF1990 family protein [Acidimicrobiales bacterium]
MRWGARPAECFPTARHGRQVLELGCGDDVFERASEGLQRWQARLGAGATVHPQDAPVAEGSPLPLVVPVPVYPWATTASGGRFSPWWRRGERRRPSAPR